MGGIFLDSDMCYVRFGDWFVELSVSRASSLDVEPYVRWPLASTLEKQLSIIRRFSSSKRSARLMPADGGGCDAEGGPREA